jgi:hypothetical protein
MVMVMVTLEPMGRMKMRKMGKMGEKEGESWR